MLLLILIYISKPAMALITTFLIVLFPSPQTGWLFGYDSHASALITKLIVNSGWPISGTYLPGGFQQTPLLHFHTALASSITGLSIFPDKSPQLLITHLIPMVYVASAIAFSYCIVRLYITTGSNSNDVNIPNLVFLVPVLFWIPLFDWKTAYRRQSIGIVLFVCSLFLVLKFIESRDKMFSVIGAMTLISMVIAHHLTTLMAAWTLVFILAAVYLSDRKDVNRSQIWVVIVLFGVTITSWYIASGYGISEILLGIIVRNLELLGRLGQTTESVPNEINPSMLTVFRTFYSKWLYHLILGGAIFFLAVNKYYSDNEIELFDIFSLMFGSFIAIAAAFSLPFTFLDSYRLMTFFTVICGFAALKSIVAFSSRTTWPITRIFMGVLIILSATMIPPHAVSQTEPNYEGGEKSERFSQEQYAVAEFIDYFGTSDRIIGDQHTQEIVARTAQLPVKSDPSAIENGTVPMNAYIILAKRNNQLYWGKSYTKSGTYYNKVKFNNASQTLSKNNNLIYSTGNESVYE